MLLQEFSACAAGFEHSLPSEAFLTRSSPQVMQGSSDHSVTKARDFAAIARHGSPLDGVAIALGLELLTDGPRASAIEESKCDYAIHSNPESAPVAIFGNSSDDCSASEDHAASAWLRRSTSTLLGEVRVVRAKSVAAGAAISAKR